MYGTRSLEVRFGKEFGQHALNNYRGSRSWGQLHQRAESVSSDTCECCAEIRQSLLRAAVEKRIVIWLVNVKKLYAARRRSGSQERKPCGFCAIVYQQFWAWQEPVYRLKSQVLAGRLRRVDQGDEMVPWTIIKGWWEDVDLAFDDGSTPCFREGIENYSKSCAVKTCNVCQQDTDAELEFGPIDLLCEPCQFFIRAHHEPLDEDVNFDPSIPLLLRPRIIRDGSSFSTLGIKHAAGVRTNNGSAAEWIWAMYTLPDDKVSSYIPSYRQSSHDDERVYNQIKTWLSDCSTHQTCRRRRSDAPVLPARVLDLADTSCKLHITTGETGQYVALSYCWGTPQPQKLTLANLEDYKTHIDLSSLPKTIQDAVIATRHLGFRYLWVDSVCIVQDDEVDKLAQLAKMRHIYADSSLTICASGAAACNEGFFHTASAPGTSVRTPDVGVNYPCELPDGGKGHVRLIERAEYRPLAEPLTLRGWTYQEEMLPISIVRFGACLTWECDEVSESRTVSSLTGGIDSQVPFSTLFVGNENNQYWIRRILHELLSGSSPHDAHTTAPITRDNCPASQTVFQDQTPSYMMQHCHCPTGPFHAAWQFVVTQYTTRRLSESTDKFPALAGLAEAFSRARNDEYLAGLWRSRLVHDLMWRVRLGSVPKADEARRRRPPWRAPSWSWASVDVGIQIVGAHGRILECHLDNCTVLAQREVAEVVEYHVQHRDAGNPFGAVTHGSITLRGPLRKLRFVKGDYLTMLRVEETEFQLISESFSVISHPNDFASAHLDLVQFQNSDLESLGSLEEGIDLWCLQMREEKVASRRVFPGMTRPTEITLMDGLVLLPVDETTTTFRRIGCWVTEYRAVVEEAQHPFRGIDAAVLKIV